jgi:ribosome-binding protein aMBF1 (putative translation factor)
MNKSSLENTSDCPPEHAPESELEQLENKQSENKQTERPKSSRGGTVDDRLRAFQESLGEWLRDGRLTAGLTVSDAAELLTVEVNRIEEIEAGTMMLTGADLHELLGAYKITKTDANAFLEEFGLSIA